MLLLVFQTSQLTRGSTLASITSGSGILFFWKAPETALKILTFFKGVGKDIWHFSQRAMLGHLKDVWTHWFLKSLFPILLLVHPLKAMFLWNSGTCRDLWYEGGKKSCTLLFPTKAADPLLRSLHFDQITSKWTNSCTCISRPLQIHYFAAFILIK